MPGLGHALEKRQRGLGFLIRQNGRRFVENEDFRAKQKYFEDFYALLLGDREILDQGMRIDVETDFPSLGLDRRRRRVPALDAEPRPAGQHDVFGDAKTLHQFVMLMNHANAET